MTTYQYGRSDLRLRPVTADTPPPRPPVTVDNDLAVLPDDEQLVRLYEKRATLDRAIAECEARVARRAAALANARRNAAGARRKADEAHRARLAETIAQGVAESRLTAAVAAVTGVLEGDLFSRGRVRPVADARLVAYKVATDLGWSSTRTGEWIGRDHTTVLYGLRAIAERPDLIEKAQQVRDLLDAAETDDDLAETA